MMYQDQTSKVDQVDWVFSFSVQLVGNFLNQDQTWLKYGWSSPPPKKNNKCWDHSSYISLKNASAKTSNYIENESVDQTNQSVEN